MLQNLVGNAVKFCTTTPHVRVEAEDTGGQVYTRESVSSLPEDITISGAGVTLVEEHDLWDMPAIFLLLVLLMGAEWGFRRVRGLV